MGEGALSWVKEHPYATALVVFGVGILLVIFISSGSTPTQDTSGAAAAAAAQAQEAASGNQLQELQAQLAAAGNANTAGLTANSQDNATAEVLAQIEASLSQNANQTNLEATKVTAQYNAEIAEGQSSAAVQVNHDNDTTTATMDLYDRLVASLNIPPTGAFINGSFNPSTGAFSIGAQPNSQNQYGTPYYITSPSGQNYTLLSYQGSGLPVPDISKLPTGTIQGGGVGIFYVPEHSSVTA